MNVHASATKAESHPADAMTVNVWRGDRDGEFFVNVSNVFDSNPILLPETGLAANSTYSDLLGRTFRVGVRLQLR